MTPGKDSDAAAFGDLGQVPVRTGVWTTIGRVGGLVAFALSTALLAVLLASGELGSFFVIQALVAFASPVAAAGNARSATLVFSGRAREEFAAIDRAWSASRNRQVLCGSLGSLGLVAFVLLLPLQALSLSIQASLAAGVCAVGLGWQLVLAEALRAGGNVKVANLGTGRSGGVITQCSFVVLLVGAWLLRRDLGLWSALNLYTVSVLVGLVHLLVGYFVMVKAGSSPEPKRSGEVEAAVVLDPAALAFPSKTVKAELLVAGLNQLDLLLAGMILVGGPLATYALARRLSMVLATPQLIGALSAMPSIAVLLKQPDRGALTKKLGRISFFALAATLVGGFVVGLTLEWSARLLDIADPADLQLAFLIMACAQGINAATGPSGTVLLLDARQDALTRHSLANLVLVGASFGLVTVLDGGALMLSAALGISMGIRFLSLHQLAVSQTGVSTAARLRR